MKYVHMKLIYKDIVKAKYRHSIIAHNLVSYVVLYWCD